MQTGKKINKVALFSLNDTSKADYFAEQLIKAGWKIIATAETVKLLNQKGLSVQDIADFVGINEKYNFPPTLHAKVENALTADTTDRIDLVYVIPYPLAQGNDVGGHTLLALAIKGGRTAVMNVNDMEKVVTSIVKNNQVSDELRLELADKINFEIAEHYFGQLKNKEKYDGIFGQHNFDLQNGENPYQIPASAFSFVIQNDQLSLFKFKQVSGELPCYTNLADGDSILTTLSLIAEACQLNIGSVPYICIAAKHGNACGLGISQTSPLEAVEKALFGNPRSIWGGEVITNFAIDEQLAKILFKSKQREKLLDNNAWMLDIIMAPKFTPEAISVLGHRQQRKLLENSALEKPFLNKLGHTYRLVRGGFLRQPSTSYILNLKDYQEITQQLSEDQLFSIIIAWAVAFSSFHGGNEVALAKDKALLGTGGGPSTVEAVKVALTRIKECGHESERAVFAADAFFPFTDVPELLCQTGVKIGCVPGGGKNQTEVKTYFKEHKVKVIFLPSEIRGFCRH